jgi:predicted oxidoreductase
LDQSFYCRINRITIQAWSPFQTGFFAGTFFGSPDYPELNAVIDRLAAHYDVTLRPYGFLRQLDGSFTSDDYAQEKI